MAPCVIGKLRRDNRESPTAYCAYLVFQLFSHTHLYQSTALDAPKSQRYEPNNGVQFWKKKGKDDDSNKSTKSGNEVPESPLERSQEASTSSSPIAVEGTGNNSHLLIVPNIASNTPKSEMAPMNVDVEKNDPDEAILPKVEEPQLNIWVALIALGVVTAVSPRQPIPLSIS